MKLSCTCTWAREPVDTRLGIMFGSQYDIQITGSDRNGPQTVPCIRFDCALGLLWVNVRFGLIIS